MLLWGLNKELTFNLIHEDDNKQYDETLNIYEIIMRSSKIRTDE
jgi:hypothetical protein